MPRLPKDTPTMFGADDVSASAAAAEPAREQQVSATDPEASEPPEGLQQPDQPSTEPPASGSASSTRTGQRAAASSEDQTLRQRRARAEKRANKYLDSAVEFVGAVVTANKKKIKSWSEVPERLRAALYIIELGAGKNPTADNDDKGRPKILIGFAAPTETAHILPPDYTSH